MSFERFRSSLIDPRLILLADYWNGLRAGRRLPGWKQIDPIDIAPCLPIIWAWRWDAAQQSFIGILAGEETIKQTGGNLRNQLLGDFLPPTLAEKARNQFRLALDGPALAHSKRFIRNMLGFAGSGERIILPLAADGERADAVVGASVHHFPGSPQVVETQDDGERDEHPSYFSVD